LPPEIGKRVKDLKDCLLSASDYVADPRPRSWYWKGVKLEPPA